MLPVLVDIFGCVVIYFVMMMIYNVIHSLNIHSPVVRIASSFFAYVILLFITDYLINVVLLTIDFYTSANFGAGLEWFSLALLTGLFYRAYMYRTFEKGDRVHIDEMKNFIRESLMFRNYIRLMDVDTQEQIGKHKMKTIYEEVHGKPFAEDVIATAFDEQVTKFKKVSIEELKKKKKQYPLEYFDEVSRLNSNQTTDVSVSFRFQLRGNIIHPLLPLMDHFEIDPTVKIFSVSIMFPIEKNISMETPAEQVRMVERVYESLHILVSQDWFSLYVPFFTAINVKCSRKEFNSTMNETIRSLMTFKISLHDLQIRSSRITTGTEIKRIAEIHFG